MSWLRIGAIAALVAGVAFLVWAVIDRGLKADELAALRAHVDVCDQAIDAGETYGVRTSCSPSVKKLAAERDAANESLASANANLATANRDRDAAIMRAEARSATLAERNTANDRTIDAAPHGNDGRVRCDAGCLRALAGDAR